jgi:hypothetical protein
MRAIVDKLGNIALPENPLVLTTGPLVGMGDHAVYSTLPRRFKELGYTVLLDKDNRGRNDDMMEMIWARNPYIDGQTDLKPNAGYVRQGLIYEVANRYDGNGIGAVERAHGLPPPYSIAPYINYEPKAFPVDLTEAVLVDFSAVSSSVSPQGIEDFIRAMKGRFRNPQMIQVIPPKFASLHAPQLAMDSVRVNSVAEYLDALHSCRAWVGSEAGAQSFAAIARGEYDKSVFDARPEIVCCITVQTFNDQVYVYAGSNYRPTAVGTAIDHDYHFPHEMTTHQYEVRCDWSYEQMRSEDPNAWKAVL